MVHWLIIMALVRISIELEESNRFYCIGETTLWGHWDLIAVKWTQWRTSMQPSALISVRYDFFSKAKYLLFCTLSKVASIPTDSPPPTTDPPLVVTLTGIGIPTAGESYILICTASGGGTNTATYQWYRNGALLITPSSPDRFTFSCLWQRAHSEEYTCTVTREGQTTTSNTFVINVGGNLLGEKTAILKMPVSYLAPDVTASVSRSGDNPMEGCQYTLTCTLSGHQSLIFYSVTYQWLMGSSTVQGPNASNTLVFNSVSPDDSGMYTCLATVSSLLLNSNITAQGSTTFSVTGTNGTLSPVFPLPARPVVSISFQGATSITVSWTQLAGGCVDSYTVQWNATVRGCGTQSQGGPTSTGTQRSFVISNLEEDSDVSGTVSSNNPGGSVSASFSTSTLTASMSHCTEMVLDVKLLPLQGQMG